MRRFWQHKNGVPIARLKEGETLFLYTDGLTEAMNSEKEEFGEERLAKFLAEQKGLGDLKEMLNRLSLSVEDFRAGAEPNDDFTVLFLRHIVRTVSD